MSRLVMISNRLPVSVSKDEKGKLVYSQSVGGVATGIASLAEPEERVWFGWPGITSEQLCGDDIHKITRRLQCDGCSPIFLNNIEVDEFYDGFSNETIWPLFHYFPSRSKFSQEHFDTYRQVNQLFCDRILSYLQPSDNIWIHDYQLMLLPQMIREKMPEAHIGFFLHIPFPSFELIRHLPWRMEILEGVLGADLIGFHEYDYVRHFLSSVYRITGHDHYLSELTVRDRLVRVDAFPMGIDYKKYSNCGKLPEVKAAISNFRNSEDCKLIISIDRLDYTKGILHRLDAYDTFLRENSEYIGKVSLVMIAVPSRTSVEEYVLLREELERTVSRINGNFGTINWTPIQYMYRAMPFEELAALYNTADLALITPLRDGMNLVAKEFVACQSGRIKQGMLVLSEMAGAASELGEALVVNPFDRRMLVEAIKKGLKMPDIEKQRRNALMQTRLARYTVGHWADDFLRRLSEVINKQEHSVTRRFAKKYRTEVQDSYHSATSRLLLFDYDGTLMPFFNQPESAEPDHELLDLLSKLTEDARNEVIIISGRNRITLEEWLGHLSLSLVAEHGGFIRDRQGNWRSTIAAGDEWKNIVRPILELYADRTPGAFVEEKTYSLVWHCRKSEPDLAKLRTKEIKNALYTMTSNLNIGVFEGNKIVEVKDITANKGHSILNWISQQNWEFVFCAGDDYTDEDMFNALPDYAISCKIGSGQSNADYRLENPAELREFLGVLIK